MRYVIALSAVNDESAPDFTPEMSELLRRLSTFTKSQDPGNVIVIGDHLAIDKNMVEVEIQDFNL